jgi:hypothetical protein
MAIYLDVKPLVWLGNALPVPPTHGQPETGLIMRQAADPENDANETHAIMGVS